MKTLKKLVGNFHQGDRVVIVSKKYQGLIGYIGKILYDDERSKCTEWEGNYPIRIDLSGDFQHGYQRIYWAHCKQIKYIQ